MEVAEKLRSQVRELEKEKRDIQRRYNEQVRFAYSTHWQLYTQTISIRRPALRQSPTDGVACQIPTTV